MRFGFAAVTAMLPLPISSLGRPLVRRVHVSPPLVDLKTPPSRAPDMIVHGLRSMRDITAYTTSGFPGMSSTSAAPVLSDRYRTFCHDLPPSFVRKTPRSSLRLNALPVAERNAMSGLVGWTRMAPICPASRRPAKDQVAPASVDL